MMQSLIIGGIRIPLYASLQVRQEYSAVDGTSRLRMASGKIKTRRRWPAAGVGQYWATSISGSGTIPAPILQFKRDVPYRLDCVERMSVYSATVSVPLPLGSRVDAGYAPVGLAMMADGTLVETPIVSLVANVATLTAVAGAIQYQVDFYPSFDALIDFSVWGEPYAANRGWQITAEEYHG